jgi:hypothetical protein
LFEPGFFRLDLVNDEREYALHDEKSGARIRAQAPSRKSTIQ